MRSSAHELNLMTERSEAARVLVWTKLASSSASEKEVGSK